MSSDVKELAAGRELDAEQIEAIRVRLSTLTESHYDGGVACGLAQTLLAHIEQTDGIRQDAARWREIRHYLQVMSWNDDDPDERWELSNRYVAIVPAVHGEWPPPSVEEAIDALIRKRAAQRDQSAAIRAAALAAVGGAGQ